MYLISFTKQILHEMSGRKLRSALAIFCIAWGTLTVALLLAIGNGFHTASKKNILNIAENVFSVIPGETSKTYRGKPTGRLIHIRISDILPLPQLIPNIQEVSPLFIVRSANLVYKNKQLQKKVHSIGPSFVRMRKIHLEPPGRFFNDLDVSNASRVVVLGHKLKTELFSNTEPLGEKILINNVAFTVIGVIAQFTKNVYNWYDNSVLIPYTTFLSINGDTDINVVAVSPNPTANTEKVQQDVRSYFAYKFDFDRNDESALRVFSGAKMMRFFSIFFLAIQIFLGACGALTLGAGSIGIANLMFLIVTERTKEIGLRKALGACKRHILLQILVEALVIVILGGMIGFAVAYVIILILQYVPLPEWLGTPTISWLSMVTIVGVLALFGLAAGYFPAQRAANMDPVEALTSR